MSSTPVPEPTRPMPQLRMWRPTLDGLPPLQVPSRYTLRSFVEGPADVAAWQGLMAAAFGPRPSPLDFDVAIRAEVSFLPERLLFVCCDGEPVAVAGAFERPQVAAGAGMLHYVAALPGHSGRGLGRAVVLAALHRMVADSLGAAWLSTDDHRLPALKVYLDLGFEPLLMDESHRERWPAVLRALGREADLARYAALLAGPLGGSQDRPLGGRGNG